jgi:hypothetical protein
MVALLLATPLALAHGKIHVGTLTIDGQTVRDMDCELDAGGLGAVMKMVGALAKQKKALDECAPGGAAYRVKWTWTGGRPSAVEVLAASEASGSACLGRALKLIQSQSAGECRAIVLVGQADAAARAAATLAAPAK